VPCCNHLSGSILAFCEKCRQSVVILDLGCIHGLKLPSAQTFLQIQYSISGKCRSFSRLGWQHGWVTLSESSAVISRVNPRSPSLSATSLRFETPCRIGRYILGCFVPLDGGNPVDGTTADLQRLRRRSSFERLRRLMAGLIRGLIWILVIGFPVS